MKLEAGQVVDTADFIADQGPWLMPDLIAGRDRDIILQHLGDDPETGWHAFAARPAAAPRDCFLEWNASDETFTDNCDGTTYDAIGTGLTQYPVFIDANGNLAIDINAADRPPSDGSDVESVENTGNDGG